MSFVLQTKPLFQIRCNSSRTFSDHNFQEFREEVTKLEESERSSAQS